MSIPYIPRANATTVTKAFEPSEVYELIKNPPRQLLQALQEARADKRKKARLPALAFSICAASEGYRGGQGIVSPGDARPTKETITQTSGLYQLDFDSLASTEDATALRDLIPLLEPSVVFAFLSPRQLGVKVIVRGPPVSGPDAVNTHYGLWQKIADKFKRYTPSNGTFDTAVKDPARICYLSHDPDAFYNPDATVFDVDAPLPDDDEELDPLLDEDEVDDEHQLALLNTVVSSRDELRMPGAKITDLPLVLEYIHPREDRDNWRKTLSAVHAQWEGTEDEEQAVTILKEWSQEKLKFFGSKKPDVYGGEYEEGCVEREWKGFRTDKPRASLFLFENLRAKAVKAGFIQVTDIKKLLRSQILAKKRVYPPTRENIHLWLRNDPAIKNRLMLEVTTGEACYRPFESDEIRLTDKIEDLPAPQKLEDLNLPISQLSIRYYSTICSFHEPTAQIVKSEIEAYILENPYNPVADYYNSLKWDGKPRLDTAAQDFLLLEDSEVMRAKCRAVFILPVVLAFNLGYATPFAFSINGARRCGKTSFVRALAPPHLFLSQTLSLSEINGTNFLRALRGKSVYLDDEAAGATRTSPDALKAFITGDSITIRRMRKDNETTVPRTAAIFFTPNEGQVLSEGGGDRRIINIHVPRRSESLDALIERSRYFASIREQVTAEAVHLLRSGQYDYIKEFARLVTLGQVQNAETASEDLWGPTVENFMDEVLKDPSGEFPADTLSSLLALECSIDTRSPKCNRVWSNICLFIRDRYGYDKIRVMRDGKREVRFVRDETLVMTIADNKARAAAAFQDPLLD